MAVRDGAATTMVQDVHVLPLAREFDRAVLPFLPGRGRPPPLHAHRIHLVAFDDEASRRLAGRVERALRPLAAVEIHTPHNTRGAVRGVVEFDSMLALIGGILRRERTAGHRVHINLTSGTKLQALAAGMAGMAHLRPGEGSLYYVQPSEYTRSAADFEAHGLSKGLVDVQSVTLVPLLLPPPLQLQVLGFLRPRSNELVEYRQLIHFLSKVPDSGYADAPTEAARLRRRWTNATTTRMVRTIIQPLAAEGLLEVAGLGRKRGVRITRRGLLYAALAAPDVHDVHANV